MLTQYFSIHGLLAIKLERLRAHPLDDYLLRALGQYEQTESATRPPDLHIRINPASPVELCASNTTIVDNHWYANEHQIAAQETHKGGKWSAEIEHLDTPGRTCLVTVHTNHLGRMVYPSDLIYPVIRLLLNLRGVADAHGSSVSKDGKGYLFAGRSGVGKTITAVNFMRRGYCLLGDDESWLYGGQVLSHLTPINIRYTYNSAEALGIKLSPRQYLAVQSKKWLARLSGGRVTLFTRFSPEEFKSKVAKTARLQKAYVSMPADHFAIEHDVEPALFIRQLVVNNQFEMRGFEGYRLAYAHVHPETRLADYWELHTRNLARSLSGVACHRILMPSHYTQTISERIPADVEA
jgi:hypothetical protein